MDKIVVIVAAGSGRRMKSELPKQFMMLAGLPVLMHTIKKFWNYDNNIRIIVVLPQDRITYWKKICREYRFKIAHEIRKGGDTRFQSVKNGLRGIKPGCLVAIHDGVRPLVSRYTIKRCFSEAETKGTAVPVVEICESVRLIDGVKNSVVDRKNLRVVQTPQVFQSELLIKAYKQKFNPEFTDDAMVVEGIKKSINLVEGNLENVKITNKKDFTIAEAFYKNTELI